MTWNSTNSGNYTATIDVSAGALSGSGDWIVEVQNAYGTGATVTYDLQFTFDGPCAGECPDPLACNYVPEDEQTNPLLDVCEYAEDLFGEGYDCDGVCLNDEDGDGICDEDDDCFGSYDECGNCGGTDPRDARMKCPATTIQMPPATTVAACTSMHAGIAAATA